MEKHAKHRLFKTFLLSLSIIAWVTILFLVFCSISLAVSKTKTGIPKLFGSSVVQVSSTSMVKAGFDVGDYALVRSCNTEKLLKGDYILFYYHISSNVFTPSQVTAEDIPLNVKTVRKTAKLVLHEIIAIETDVNGHRWFVTKGANNPDADGWIYDEYVVGKHQKISKTEESLLQFFMSVTGRVIIICIPVFFLIALDIYRVVLIVNEIKYLKKERTPKLKPQNQEQDDELKNKKIDQPNNGIRK